MTWNYRIMRNTKGKHVWLGIHEVYYDESGKPYLWTEEPIICVDEDEGVEGIKSTLEMMLNDVERSKHEILPYKDPDQDAAEKIILEEGGGHDHALRNQKKG